MSNSIVVIPSRLASTRLPNKPLLSIGKHPMIIWCVAAACKSDVDLVIVATPDNEIAACVNSYKGKSDKYLKCQVVMTDANCASGSDRVMQAVQSYDAAKECKYIINYQGDMPFAKPQLLNDMLYICKKESHDIVTMACPFKSIDEAMLPQNVKVILKENSALDFFRIINKEDINRVAVTQQKGNIFHHIGMYGYQRKALEKFVASPMSIREKSEKLEQLRALSLKQTIGLSITNHAPMGIDTNADYQRAKLEAEQYNLGDFL